MLMNNFFHVRASQVRTVAPGSPAEAAGLRARDIVSRINGRLVFHLEHLADIERLIRDSGTQLFLDIER